MKNGLTHVTRKLTRPNPTHHFTGQVRVDTILFSGRKTHIHTHIFPSGSGREMGLGQILPGLLITVANHLKKKLCQPFSFQNSIICFFPKTMSFWLLINNNNNKLPMTISLSPSFNTSPIFPTSPNYCSLMESLHISTTFLCLDVGWAMFFVDLHYFLFSPPPMGFVVYFLV